MTRIALLILAVVLLAFGPAAAQLTLTHVGPGSSAAAPPPGNCNGTIDLSTGCVQPMMGGL